MSTYRLDRGLTPAVEFARLTVEVATKYAPATLRARKVEMIRHLLRREHLGPHGYDVNIHSVLRAAQRLGHIVVIADQVTERFGVLAPYIEARGQVCCGHGSTVKSLMRRARSSVTHPAKSNISS